ncbi:MAG: alpha/beta hydrolase [Alphaproteobacteria bacterium]|nr:alpha/beta hydrolase [Alphaproteobacteria bacterium]
MRALVPIVVIFLVAGCTRAGLLAANAPGGFDDIRRIADVRFSSDPGLSLDIYVPPRAGERELPVVVYFHGGRWTNGDKDMYQFVGAALAGKGYVVVIPDYRTYPHVRFPAFVEDGARAVSWVSGNIAGYGGNPRAIFLMGHSSGAHIASLIATDPSYLKAQGADHGVVRAFAGLAGPYAFTPEADDLKDIFGPPDRYPLMQATNFVSADDPPMLLLRGADDTVVGAFNAERLARALREAGVPVEVRTYEGVNHLEIVGALTWFWRGKAPVLDDVDRFFKRYAP